MSAAWFSSGLAPENEIQRHNHMLIRLDPFRANTIMGTISWIVLLAVALGTSAAPSTAPQHVTLRGAVGTFPNFQTSLLQETTDDLDQAIQKLVEKATSNFASVIDPLKIEKGIAIDNRVMGKIKIQDSFIRNMNIKSLSHFNLKKVHADLAELEFSVSLGFSKVQADGEYKVNAHAENLLDVWGDGDFKVQLKDLAIDAKVGITYENKHFQLKEIDIDVSLGTLTAIINNLLGGGAISELISGIVSDVGPEFVEEFKPEVKEAIAIQGRKLINEQLKQWNVDDIIDIITGEKPLPIPGAKV